MTSVRGAAKLRQVAAVGLTAMATGIFGILLFGGSFVVQAFIAAMVALLVAGLLVLTRVRWLTVVGALQGTVAVIGASQAELFRYRLTHLDDTLLFVSAALQILGAATAAIAGIGAAFASYRKRRARPPVPANSHVH